jgi:hypothetical protein
MVLMRAAVRSHAGAIARMLERGGDMKHLISTALVAGLGAAFAPDAAAQPGPTPSCTTMSWGTFQTAPFPTTWASGVTAADINVDGNLDLAIANFLDGTVDVRYGDGHGGFSAPLSLTFPNLYNNGSSPTPVRPVIADVNGDGRLDLVVNLLLLNQISVRLGLPAGGFAPGTNYFMQVGNAAGAEMPALGDLNEDGKLDVVTPNATNADGIAIRFGDGSGGFGPVSGIGLGDEVPGDLALADVNGDGHLDIVVHASYPAGILTFLGDGAGHFGGSNFSALTSGVTAAPNLNGLAIADLDGDSKLDVAVGDLLGNLWIGRGDGTGMFHYMAPWFSLGGRMSGVTAADVNGDGHPDLIATSTSGQAMILVNNGAGGFSTSSVSLLGGGTTPPAAGDFDNDGRIDFAAGSMASNGDAAVQLFRNTCSSNQAPAITGSTLTRQVGAAPSAGTIAVVSDDLTPAASLTLSIGSVPSGLSVSGLTNANGTVSALVGATCSTTTGPRTFSLTVTDDGGLSTNADVVVDATADAAPSLGKYPDATALQGTSTTVTPDALPFDNGSVNTILASAPGFTGSLSVDIDTGVITALNPGPVGVYTVTVIASDNCGSTASRTFTLTVRGVATVSLSNLNAAYDGQPHYAAASTTPAGLKVTIAYSQAGVVVTAPVNAGSYNVVATVHDGLYDGGPANATMTIGRATPILTWPAPAAIAYGTPLGAGQLNASSSVPGVFTYVPAAGTLLAPGLQTLRALFQPADAVNYAAVEITTPITVSSQREAKQLLLVTLQTIRNGVTSTHAARKLDDASRRVGESLDPGLWAADGIHLDAERGGRVFELEKEAATKIQEVIREDRSGVPAATLASLVAGFAQIDRQLAVTAAAGATPAVDRGRSSAPDEIGAGDAALAAGRYEAAFERYRSAWRRATDRD